MPLIEVIKKFEFESIRLALAENGYDQILTAKALGLTKAQFQHRMKKHNLLWAKEREATLQHTKKK